MTVTFCYTLTSPYWSSSVSTENVSTVVTKLCGFFRDLCARTIRINYLDRFQLEIILLPAFFDIIIHLAIHLPYETKSCWSGLLQLDVSH